MTQISNLQSNMPIHHEKILQQERLEEYYNNKKRMEEQKLPNGKSCPTRLRPEPLFFDDAWVLCI